LADQSDHPSLAKGLTLQFRADGTFVDATDPENPITTTQDLTGQVTWKSLDIDRRRRRRDLECPWHQGQGQGAP